MSCSALRTAMLALYVLSIVSYVCDVSRIGTRSSSGPQLPPRLRQAKDQLSHNQALAPQRVTQGSKIIEQLPSKTHTLKI